jgi:hypothetical protein
VFQSFTAKSHPEHCAKRWNVILSPFQTTLKVVRVMLSICSMMPECLPHWSVKLTQIPCLRRLDIAWKLLCAVKGIAIENIEEGS